MGVVAYLVLFVSLALAAQAVFSLYLMLYTWEHPERLETSGGPRSFLPPRLSFTVLLPARHEEAVIYRTIKSVWAADYPQELLEIVVVCSDDDVGTVAEAGRAVREIGSPRVRVETFSGKPINKPRGLNVGFERTGNEIVTIFDAEDDIDPDIFNVVNTVMLEEEVGVVQSGVQLMNFRDHWFSVHNCLEYFFWFKSRLHFHARVGMIPLGGNTVFMRRSLIRKVGGWAEDCLTEDAEIGLRMSALGEKIRVVYHAQHVTREETPDTVSSFVKQRTRWHQGFLQILRRGSWLRLSTLTQKLLALYTLSYSVFQGLVMLLWPLAIFAVFFMDVPVGIAMVSFLPLYALLLQLLITIVGMFAFAKEYSLKYSIFTPVAMTLTFVPFQFLLGISALRAMYREARNQTNWEKTAHLGAHRRPEIAFPTAYESLLDDALAHLGADRGSVMVLDNIRQAFTIESSRGLPEEVAGSAGIGVGQSVAGWVARENRPVIINGGKVPEGLDARLGQPNLKSSIVLPVNQQDRVVAVLNVSSNTSNLTNGDLRWLNERLDALTATTQTPTVRDEPVPEPKPDPTPLENTREPGHETPRETVRGTGIPTTEPARPRSRSGDGRRPRRSGRVPRSRPLRNTRRSRRERRRAGAWMSSLVRMLNGAGGKLPSAGTSAGRRPASGRYRTIAATLLVCCCTVVAALALARDPDVAEAITAPVSAVGETISRVSDRAEPANGAGEPQGEPPADERAQSGGDGRGADDVRGQQATPEAPARTDEESVECGDAGTKCLVDLAAEEIPNAEYVGGRIEIAASGERRNVLFFEDLTLDECDSMALRGPTQRGASEYVMIVGGAGYFGPEGANCDS